MLPQKPEHFFVGQRNVWVDDLVIDRTSLGLAQWLIQHAILGIQPGQLEVIVFDDTLSGLAAPFQALNTGGEKLLRTVHDTEELSEILAFLRDHVQGVNNVMQGLAPSLADFRRRVDYPVESFKLVVVSTDVSMLDEQLQNQLSILLRSGPRAGVSFLIHSVTMDVEFLADMCERWSVRGGVVHCAGHPLGDAWHAPDARELIASSRSVAGQLATQAMPPLAFDSVQPLNRPWTENSTGGISFAIGRYGLNPVEITLGDELNQRHNMLVTGAVGQGKSNLLSVMIHSLCQRYSPDELNLYLLDFKEGVTLRPFFDEKTGKYLPHARVLGLEADREFGLNLFRHLHRIYKERMRAFKAAGVQSLPQYRTLFPETAMPRLLVMVDEFQMMFAEQDQISDEIADLLVKGVRLFRACGIHFVLASQTIGGNLSLMGSTGEGLFAQVPVRIALKNSLAESHATLGVKNDAAVHLRARQAVVNLDYGEPSANRKISIAFANDQLLSTLRHTWWEEAQATSSPSVPPSVFEGERPRSLADDAAWLAGRTERDLVALLGYQIAVDASPMAVSFRREIGRNIALVGSGEAAVQIVNTCLSLALQAREDASFVFLEFADNDDFWRARRDEVLAAIRAEGSQVTVCFRAQAGEVLAELADSVLAAPDGLDREVIVVGLGMDRCRSLPLEFADLCKNGPAAGVHLIGWWRKLDSFREQVGYGGENYFDTKIALRLDASSAKQFMNDPLLEWRPAENRALVWDSAELSEPTRIIPYTRFFPPTHRTQP